MTGVITERPTPRAKPEISLDFTPKGAAFAYTAGASTFIPAGAWHIAIDTEITFTATATFFQSDENAISYLWDFGDGFQGYGESVAHSYALVNPIQVVLTVTDNKGGHHRCRRQLYPV